MRFFHKFTIVLLSGLFMMLLGMAPVALAENAAEFAVWPAKIIYDAEKVWMIQFNMPLDPGSVTDGNIYILSGEDRFKTKAGVSGVDGSIVEITPQEGYEMDREYKLYITGEVACDNGRRLKTPVVLPFFLVDGKAKIQHITCIQSFVLSSVTVRTSADVHKVKIGTSDEMHYVGNNTFNLGLPDLQGGKAITIRAYDENNRLLETKKYIPALEGSRKYV